MDLDYKKDISIDVNALDVEWANQAATYAKYAEESAAANAVLRKLEEKLKVTRSELTLEAASNPSLLGDGVKPTADNIEAYYRTHPRHKSVKAEWEAASYEAEMLQNAVFAFQQKKVALENLVRLLAATYFAGPVEPRDLPAEMAKSLRTHREEKEKGDVRTSAREALNQKPVRRRNQQEA